MSPLFQSMVFTVFTGALFLARSAQVSAFLPVDTVVFEPLLVIPATLLCVQPDKLVVTVRVCLAGVLLTPGEIVAVPVRVQVMDGFGLAAAAGPAASVAETGTIAATTTRAETRRILTGKTPLAMHFTPRLKCQCSLVPQWVCLSPAIDSTAGPNPPGESFPVDHDDVNQVAPPTFLGSSTRAAARLCSVRPTMGKVRVVGHRARTRSPSGSSDPVAPPVNAANLLDPSRPMPAVSVLGLAQLAQAARTGRRSRRSGSSQVWRQEVSSASVLLAEAGPSANR